MIWIVLIAAVCFGGGLFWMSRLPAGWNWQKWTAAAVMMTGPLLLVIATSISKSGASVAKSDRVRPVERLADTNPGNAVMTTTGNIQKVNAESFDKGRDTAYDPPQKFGRRTGDIRPVQIGTNKWRICFETPGPAMIKTGLPIEQGDTYYIKMNRVAESIQFGWLGENQQRRVVFSPSPAPARALTESVPHKFTMITCGHNAQLAFNTSTIPDGRYEITITRSEFVVGPNEYAPGVPLKNRW